MAHQTGQSRRFLRVSGLKKSYAVGLGLKTVLRGVDLALPLGGLTLIYGPNGAGKTTLLRCLAGAASATAGAMHWSDELSRRTPAGSLAYVPEGGRGFHEAMTFAENLTWMGMVRGKLAATRQANSALPGLAEMLADRRPLGQQSRGQKQLAALMLAFAPAPDLLLLDEPSNGLDPPAYEQLRECLAAITAAGAGVVVSTHDPRFLEAAYDQAYFMRDGAIVHRQSDAATVLKCRIQTETDGTEGGEPTIIVEGSAAEIAAHIAKVVASARIVDLSVAPKSLTALYGS